MDLDTTLSTIAATIPQEIEQVVTQVAYYIPGELRAVMSHAASYLPTELSFMSVAQFMLYFAAASLILGVMGRVVLGKRSRMSRRCRAAQLPSIRQMSGQVSRGSACEYQADERAGVARLSWRVSGR